MTDVTNELRAQADKLIATQPDASTRALAIALEEHIFGASSGYSHERNYARCRWHIQQARKRAAGIAPGRGRSTAGRRYANQYGTFVPKDGEE